MKNYITFGQCNKYFKHIIGYIIFKLIYSILYGVKIGYSIEGLRLLPDNNLINHTLIHDIFNYIGMFIISLILMIITLIYSKKEEEKNIEEKKLKKKPRISLIHTEINQEINKSAFFGILIITILWVLYEQSERIFYLCGLTDLDYWSCEMIILAFINKKIFGSKLYRHQKFAIFFSLIIGSLLKFGSFFISLDINDQNILFIKKKYWIPLGISMFLIFITIRSYTNCKLKYLTDIKYIPILKILVLYGLSGTVISSIICIISTFKKCNSHICLITNNDITERHYESVLIYFEKINNFSNSEIIRELLYNILSSILNFFTILSYLLIIKYLTPIHIICSRAIYYILIQILLLIINKIRKKYFFIGEDYKDEKACKYALDLSNDFFSFLATLVYLELIEFNFCGCNYDLRKNIIERSKIEGNTIDEIENGVISKGSSIYKKSTFKSSDYFSRESMSSKESELSILPPINDA